MAEETSGDGLPEWVVRIERRKDGRYYFFDHNGNLNCRRSSAFRLNKEDAQNLAHALATQNETYTARAMRYDSPVHTQNLNGPTGPRSETKK